MSRYVIQRTDNQLFGVFHGEILDRIAAWAWTPKLKHATIVRLATLPTIFIDRWPHKTAEIVETKEWGGLDVFCDDLEGQLPDPDHQSFSRVTLKLVVME